MTMSRQGWARLEQLVDAQLTEVQRVEQGVSGRVNYGWSGVLAPREQLQPVLWVDERDNGPSDWTIYEIAAPLNAAVAALNPNFSVRSRLQVGAGGAAYDLSSREAGNSNSVVPNAENRYGSRLPVCGRCRTVSATQIRLDAGLPADVGVAGYYYAGWAQRGKANMVTAVDDVTVDVLTDQLVVVPPFSTLQVVTKYAAVSSALRYYAQDGLTLLAETAFAAAQTAVTWPVGRRQGYLGFRGESASFYGAIEWRKTM